MYDPTIFDNLKVVLEGGLYDLDREGRIRIIGRADKIDLASMSRAFSMRFELPSQNRETAEIELASELADFASELAGIRSVNPTRPGCRIEIRYRFSDWDDSAAQLHLVEKELQDWWSGEVQVQQIIDSVYQSKNDRLDMKQNYTVILTFLNKIGENHIEEIPGLLNHMILCFERLATKRNDRS